MPKNKFAGRAVERLTLDLLSIKLVIGRANMVRADLLWLRRRKWSITDLACFKLQKTHFCLGSMTSKSSLNKGDEVIVRGLLDRL